MNHPRRNVDCKRRGRLRAIALPKLLATRRDNDEFSRCMSDVRPIGVFDSGIGGLTVVKALRDLLPNENISYLGDTARVPYGPKSPETLHRYGVELSGILTPENAKALVGACNTG